MQEITINDISIEVLRKDIKNIHLGVYPPNGRVRIAAPLQTKEDVLKVFAITKLSWIKRQQKKFKEQERQSPREYKQRESHYFLGRRYLLNIVVQDAAPKVVLKRKAYIHLYVRPNTATEKRQQILMEWYRAELKKLVPSIITKWEERMNVQVNGWQIKQMKTKWGTCNIQKKKVWLNLELAKKPLHAIEYVVVHEMVHLLERHHNETFLAYMDKFLPNWKQLKAELNQLPVSYNEWN